MFSAGSGAAVAKRPFVTAREPHSHRGRAVCKKEKGCGSLEFATGHRGVGVRVSFYCASLLVCIFLELQKEACASFEGI